MTVYTCDQLKLLNDGRPPRRDVCKHIFAQQLRLLARFRAIGAPEWSRNQRLLDGNTMIQT